MTPKGGPAAQPTPLSYCCCPLPLPPELLQGRVTHYSILCPHCLMAAQDLGLCNDKGC